MYRRFLVIFVFFFLFANPTTDVKASWPQLAGNAQRTGFTVEEPATPWSFAWHWQPANMFTMPRSTHAVTGGGLIFMPGGSQGLYAVRISNGTQAWVALGNYQDAPAFDEQTGYLYAANTQGQLHRINSSNGQILATYSAGSAINDAVLLVGNSLYVTTQTGNLDKVDKNTMTRVWRYSGGSAATTAPTYSQSRDIIIYGDTDLYVNAVRNSNGSQAWRVKPTTLPAGSCYPYSFEYGWPVVADTAGVVFVRIRLGDNDTWLSGPGPLGKFPTTNAEIKAYLNTTPQAKSLFALSLDNGSQPFTPAVGNGGTDDNFDWCDGQYSGTNSTIGPMPAVKTLPDGKQVAYIIFRNGQTADQGFAWDGRWDAHMGEMVLDNSTVNSYTAGDMRFVYFPSMIGNGMITDEQFPITVAGNTIMHAHYGANESYTITDRSAALGSSLSNQIATNRNPVVVRRINPYSATRNDATHYLNSGMELYCDPKYWPGPGFWVYWNTYDPPSDASVCSGYGDAIRPRYTFVSDGKVFVIGNGGDIFALNHSGTIQSTPTPTQSGPTPTPTPTPSPACQADVNANGTVEIGDISGILFYWGQSCLPAQTGAACVADVNANGTVEIGDIAGALFYWNNICSN